MRAYEPTVLVVHHSAGLQGGAAIRRAHVQGVYDEVAYNDIIERDGSTYPGRPTGTKPGANSAANAGTAAVCVVGDGTVEGSEWTHAQVVTLTRYVDAFRSRYPEAEVMGHGEWAKKHGKATACPGVDLGALGLRYVEG